jgi:hypothetical protein
VVRCDRCVWPATPGGLLVYTDIRRFTRYDGNVAVEPHLCLSCNDDDIPTDSILRGRNLHHCRRFLYYILWGANFQLLQYQMVLWMVGAGVHLFINHIDRVVFSRRSYFCFLLTTTRLVQYGVSFARFLFCSVSSAAQI